MSEKIPRPESAPKADPYEVFEMLVASNQWSPEIEEKLRGLLESHEPDMYMLYLNYEESGLVDELPEHERRMYEWLKNEFKSEPE